MMDTLISPKTDYEIRHRVALKRRSVNFKNILRERFRSKLKSNRGELFNQMRKLNVNGVQNMVSQYMDIEIEYLKNRKLFSDSDCDYHYNEYIIEEMKETLIKEQIEWISKQSIEQEAEMTRVMKEYVFCPFCQKGTLSDNADEMKIVCSMCDVSLSLLDVNSEEFDVKLKYFSNEHSNICQNRPQFNLFRESDLNGVFIMCDNCSTFKQIV